MKAILILCTCIAFCRLASTMSTTDDARAAHRMKLYTRYVGEIQNDMQKKIDELSGHDMLKILKVQYLWTLSQRIMLNNLNLKISKALDDTRKYIHSITGKTINLEYCNDEQRKAFEALQNRALLMYYKCEETGIAQLTMPSADMRKIAEQGNRIVEKLDTMISSCMLSNSPVMQESCTIATISEIEPSGNPRNNGSYFKMRTRRQLKAQITHNNNFTKEQQLIRFSME
ncbi:hypothetical protein KM043_018596 [Ampulex compressa]|nr:hypothetical protein KM043_018596 [Ampulex compressa]